jgi:hypothetical protein
MKSEKRVERVRRAPSDLLLLLSSRFSFLSTLYLKAKFYGS